MVPPARGPRIEPESDGPATSAFSRSSSKYSSSTSAIGMVSHRSRRRDSRAPSARTARAVTNSCHRSPIAGTPARGTSCASSGASSAVIRSTVVRNSR